MEQGYLLDTNVVIYLLHGKLSSRAFDRIKKVLQRKARLSVITKIELLSWENDDERYIEFVDNAHVFSLDDPIIVKSIELRKKYKISLPDAVIAATAIVNQLTLFSRNKSDFNKSKN